MKVVSSALVLAGCLGLPALAESMPQQHAAAVENRQIGEGQLHVAEWNLADGSCRTIKEAHGSSCGCPLCAQSSS
jgi:hypothetical protein